MTRNFLAEDLALLDEQAARLGISRAEYLRRHLRQEARRTVTAVTVVDLAKFSAAFPDLGDDDVMSDAWS